MTLLFYLGGQSPVTKPQTENLIMLLKLQFQDHAKPYVETFYCKEW